MTKPENTAEDVKRAAKKPQTKKIKIIIAVVVIIAAVIIGFWGIMPEDYITVSDVVGTPDKYIGKEIEVKGEVYSINNGTGNGTFTLTDGKNFLNVVYNKALPTNFAVGKEVVVKGKLDENDEILMFNTNKITIGCPSKY